MSEQREAKDTIRFVELSDHVLLRSEEGRHSRSDEVDMLGQALMHLTESFEAQSRELEKVTVVTAKLNSGLFLDSILDDLYDEFKPIIPFNRMGLALLEDEGRRVTSYWSRSDGDDILLRVGFSAPIAGSSLETVAKQKSARVINDLEEYLGRNPSSEATKLLLQEGIRSSLTCPLATNGEATGFLFFSSKEKGTYASVHVAFYQRIAEQLSIILEKGRLLSQLVDQKAEIMRQNHKLLELSARKNAFVGMAAHDLRGPISSIRSVSELLLDPEMSFSPEQRTEFLEVVNRQCGHMLELINSILDIAEIESGSLNLQKQGIDVRQFVHETLYEQQMCAAKKGSSVLMETVCDGLLNADRVKLKQVLDNLLSNGIKYSPVGSTIFFGCRAEERYCVFYVRDEGPGLSAEDREQLLQDFKRLSSVPTGGERSIGLGLAISKRIVEAHRGRIEVDSSLGKGSTFTVALPWD